jgi:hypothetical protein
MARKILGVDVVCAKEVFIQGEGGAILDNTAFDDSDEV